MFEGNKFFPETCVPIRKRLLRRIKLALCEPVPLAVAMFMVKSFTILSIDGWRMGVFVSRNTADYTANEPLLRVIIQRWRSTDRNGGCNRVWCSGYWSRCYWTGNCQRDLWYFDNVIVIEKEPDFGQHVSSRHSGVVHSGLYYKPGSLKANLCVEGNRLLYDFAEKNNIEYLNCGKLIVGHNNQDLKKL